MRLVVISLLLLIACSSEVLVKNQAAPIQNNQNGQSSPNYQDYQDYPKYEDTRKTVSKNMFSDADLQQLADATVQTMSMCEILKKKSKSPLPLNIVILPINNETNEPIDTISLVEKIQLNWIRFLHNKAPLHFIYQTEDKDTMNAQFVLNGTMTNSVVPMSGNERQAVDYKLVLRFILRSIASPGAPDDPACTAEKVIRKYRS